MYQLERSKWGDTGSVRQNCCRQGEMEYLTFPLLEETGIVRHLFTTRLGGISRGDFSSLNLSFTRGDSREAVLENYNRVGEALGCSPEDMTASHQTHTTNIRVVTDEDRGKGITRPRDYDNIDGLITGERGLALVTYYADCVPLFFVDTSLQVIGLAHSGWRGTVAGMGACMVEAMEKEFGCRPENLKTAIGPSVCRDCYEVSREVAEQFIRRFGEAVVTPGRQPDKYQLDLWLANRLLLEQAGVPRENIAVTDVCTCHNCSYLYSHRVSGEKRGNLGAFLMLV